MDKELRILILEDNPADAELEEHELRKAGLVFTSKIVDTREAFLKALDELIPDIILADYDLPVFNGLEALEIVKERYPEVPFILVTGRVGEEFAIETLKKGVADYVMKGNVKRLPHSIRMALEETKLITERKQALEAIHLEMKFTEILIESLPGLFYLYELDPQSPANSRLIRFNRKHSTLTGYTPEELKNMTIKDWFEPDILEKVVRVIRLIGKRREAQANLKLRMKDGSQVPYAFSGRLLKIHDKMYFLGTGIDISDLVSAQQALQESEEKHRLVVENAHDAIIILQDGKIKFHNHQSIALSGYSTEEIKGVPFPSFIHADDKDMVMEMHRKRLLGENIPSTYSFRFINKTDETIWVQVTGILITWEGRPAALVFLRDITENKQVEDALKQSEEKFRLLAEQSPNMIFINYKGRVIYANQKCEEIIGYTRGELYSESFDFRSLIAPEYLDLVMSAFQKHMQGEEVPPYEYAILPKDGKRLDTILTTKLIAHETDKAILGIITDITERKKAEKALENEMRHIEYLNNMFLGREAKMIEMKKEVNSLLEQLGQPKKYDW